MRHFVWLSFDLGVNGDYEGMYAWLDRHEAKECGDSVACFWFEHQGDLLTDMKQELQAEVTFNTKSRVYVVRLVDGRMKGSFIVGTRRNPPWAGYSGLGVQEEDSNA